MADGQGDQAESDSGNPVEGEDQWDQDGKVGEVFRGEDLPAAEREESVARRGRAADVEAEKALRVGAEDEANQDSEDHRRLRVDGVC